MVDKETERIVEDLRGGCEPFAHTLVNVKASDILALIALIDELRGKKPKKETATP